jgi:hypothetical protein
MSSNRHTFSVQGFLTYNEPNGYSYEKMKCDSSLLAEKTKIQDSINISVLSYDYTKKQINKILLGEIFLNDTM